MEKQQPRNVREAFFQALDETDLTASSISEISGVGNSLISKFKTNGSLHCKNFQKLIDALPDRTYRKFVELLLPRRSINQSLEKSDNQIVLDLRQAARQYAKNREIERNGFRDRKSS